MISLSNIDLPIRSAINKSFLFITIVISIAGCNFGREPCDFEQTDLGLESHIHANAGCVVIQENRMLLIESRTAKLSVPGGTAERTETAACTAIRETREETGLQVQPRALLKIWENGFYLFECTLTGESLKTTISQPAEVKAIRWLDAEEFEGHAWRFKKQKGWLKEYLLSRQP